uniref:RIKEN cDNA A630095N17 gene n=1 Tax=Mus musculus TaxID=10090 RepID=A0A087WQ76_MOUSE
MAENPTFGDKDRFLTQQRRGPRLGTWLRSLPAGESGQRICQASPPPCPQGA